MLTIMKLCHPQTLDTPVSRGTVTHPNKKASISSKHSESTENFQYVKV